MQHLWVLHTSNSNCTIHCSADFGVKSLQSCFKLSQCLCPMVNKIYLVQTSCSISPGLELGPSPAQSVVLSVDHEQSSMFPCVATRHQGQPLTRTCRQIKINYSTIGGLVHIAADNGELTPTLSWKYNAILQKFFVINDVSFSVCKMHVVLL